MIPYKAQTTIEAVIVVVLVVVVFLGMQGFLRRSIQGYWKSNIDTISDEQLGQTSAFSPEITISSNLRIDIMDGVANATTIRDTVWPNITATRVGGDASSQILTIDGWVGVKEEPPVTSPVSTFQEITRVATDNINDDLAEVESEIPPD